MWRILVLLAAVSAVQGMELENKMGTVSQRCRTAMSSCSNRNVGRGVCRSLSHSLALQMIRSDTNNDCEVDEDDLKKYYKVNFDKNADGKVCSNEWNDFLTYYYGYTTETAIRMFMDNYKDDMKNQCVSVGDLDDVDDMSLRTEFYNDILEKLVDMCGKGSNMNVNRDCWGLVTLCKEIAPKMKACKKLDISKEKTLYDRLLLEQLTVDANGDGSITRQEISDDLLKNFDTNANGCVSQDEWVARYTSFYKLSPEFARASFASIQDINHDNCINIADFIFKTGGTPARDRPAYLMEKLIGICDATPKLYTENKDCAAVTDACVVYFTNLADCQPFLREKCGLLAYSNCIQQETVRGGECITEPDMFEIKFEKLKVANQVNKTCVANDINAATMPSTSPVFLLCIISLFAIFMS